MRTRLQGVQEKSGDGGPGEGERGGFACSALRSEPGGQGAGWAGTDILQF